MPTSRVQHQVYTHARCGDSLCFRMWEGLGRFPKEMRKLWVDRVFGQLTVADRVHRVNGENMSARKIQIGQLWKKKETGDTFLVTRVYNEALSTFVVLRKSGSEGEDLVRLKVERTPEGQGLPGFVPAVDDD